MSFIVCILLIVAIMITAATAFMEHELFTKKILMQFKFTVFLYVKAYRNFMPVCLINFKPERKKEIYI